MIIKKFREESFEEAQRKINEELGSQAIILTSRRVKANGVRGFFGKMLFEVTAGAEGGNEEDSSKDLSSGHLEENLRQMKEFVHHMNQSSQMGSKPPSEKQEVNQSDSFDKISLSSEAKKELLNSKAQQKNPEVTTYSPMGKVSVSSEKEENASDVETFSDLHRLSKELVQHFNNQENVEKNTVNHEVTKEMQEAHSGIELEKKTSQTQDFLVSKGIIPSLAKSIDEEIVKKTFSTSNQSLEMQKKLQLNLLKSELVDTIHTHGPIVFKKSPMMIALVGPRGVGKTTTAFKLASKYVLASKKVMVVSLDKNRSHANSQITAFTNQYGVIFKEAESYLECMELVETSGVDLAIFDTQGCGQYDWSEIESLRAFTQQFEFLETHLVVSASMKDVDIFGTVQHFSSLNVQSLIVTKVDETISLGVLANVSFKTPLLISYLSTGPSFQKDFSVATPKEIAKRILMEHNQQEYQVLRRLANT
jgi:flagellar biosynthesis protein FlhF